ncbi:MAG TPA: YdeI/OmpD-associated family protein [Candidatus Cybelea sp.]|nr:YdeI/OmpD-associated family protein [Candidatus Cybelea sp.]
MAPSRSHRFQATIYKIWMLRYVDVPEKVGRALEKESGKKKHIPVLTVLNGRCSRTTLTPAGGGRYRLPVRVKPCQAARAEVGDLIGIELRVDRESRALPVPDEIRQALKSRPQARKAFEQMGPGTRRQMLLWFGSPRSVAVRQARLARLMDLLSERALLGRGR